MEYITKLSLNKCQKTISNLPICMGNGEYIVLAFSGSCNLGQVTDTVRP